MAKRAYNKRFINKGPVATTNALPAGITDFKAVDARSHNEVTASPGHVWWVYSYKKEGQEVNGAIQITRDWSEANDVPDYIKRVYVK
jgi:hypothetical protein